MLWKAYFGNYDKNQRDYIYILLHTLSNEWRLCSKFQTYSKVKHCYVEEVKSSYLVEGSIFIMMAPKPGCTLALPGEVKNNVDFWLFVIK